MENGLFMGRDDVAYNTRIKHFIDQNGQLVPYEMMIANRNVFLESGAELCDWSKELEWKLAYREANAELYGDGFAKTSGYVPEKKTKEDYLNASRCRARRKIFDYCICNEFDIFITLTLDRDKIDRGDYSAVIKKLNTFLSNRVARRGLKYIGVPEYHKNGGLHFHFAATSNAFKLVDSGTVSVDGRKKPIRVSTADRLGVPDEKRHTVYNIADWTLGFSTAIFTYGQRGALAHYLSKELCKDVQKNLCKSGCIDKIGGRWYLHGGDLKKPVVTLKRSNFREMEGYSYSMSTDGGDFKVWKFDDNGVILP